MPYDNILKHARLWIEVMCEIMYIINKPDVAGAVLQTPLLLIHL